MYKLVEIGKERFSIKDSQTVHFTESKECDEFINDIVNYPHAFVLACLMDRQIKSERAWEIPYRICDILGTRDVRSLSDIPEDVYINLFEKYKFHRFNKDMAKVFHDGLVRIRDYYQCDASKIWSNNPSSSTVVYRFLQFQGSGVKIATMAANILTRQFRIPFSDYYSVDISPDVHVRRVLSRMGIVDDDASNDMIIYKARELYPEFPGIIDFSCWEIGREWCHPSNPDCDNCIVRDKCKMYSNL